MSHPHRLLRLLDDLVRNDRAVARLDGRVAFVVKGPDGASVWAAAFEGARLRGCGFPPGLPGDADAVMLFEADQAADVLAGEAPDGAIATFGDHDLLGAFVDRYCAFRSAIDVRMAR